MLTKLDNSIKFGKKNGGFGIDILYPGRIFPNLKDSGIAGIGRIDQARITPGTIIPMHPHRDDEILTYLRSGEVEHLDSEETTAIISPKKLMMMNAGSRLYHEEKVLEQGGTLEGLQIFIRPEVQGLEPMVQFCDLTDQYSINDWRKLAGKDQNYPLKIRSATCIEDLRLTQNSSIALPDIFAEDTVALFYVFNGTVAVNSTILERGESILIENEQPNFKAIRTSDVLLFITNKTAPYYTKGMYSGNQK